MDRVLIFGGTSEGRRLAEYCAAHGISADVSVTTELGAGLLPGSCFIRVFKGIRSAAELEELVLMEGRGMVMDATHPYARAVSAALSKICARHDIRYVRVLREQVPAEGKTVESMDEMISYVNTRRRADRELRILSTLGGKSLSELSGICGFRDYVYARVLESGRIWEEAERISFPADHIITGRGPFTKEQNLSHIRMTGAGMVLTKESGPAGGYPEKAAAAAEEGAELVTLIRPAEEGVSFDEALDILGRRNI